MKKDFTDYYEEYTISETVKNSEPLSNVDAPENTDSSASEFSIKDETDMYQNYNDNSSFVYVSTISADAGDPELPVRDYDAPEISETLNSTLCTSQNCSLRLLYSYIKWVNCILS